MRLGKMLGYLRNMLGHLKNVFVHKWWVFYYAYKLGIPWRGLIHDLSKFSWVELSESIKYYQGDKSPIPAAKQENGYSEAWQHHKGRNKHHYEYWIDNVDGDIKLVPMPYKCVLELIADWLGAYRVYNGKEDFEAEYNWWKNKCEHLTLMHPATRDLIGWILSYIRCAPDNINKVTSDNTFEKFYKMRMETCDTL